MSLHSISIPEVFIDNPAHQATKNLYNEKTLEYIRSVPVAAAYPYPYGFFLNTTSGDGDNLDCFVITDKPLVQAGKVAVEPLGVMEVIENDKADHKIIARLICETAVIDKHIQQELTAFIYKVFAHLPHKRMEVGRFLSRRTALKMITDAMDGPGTAIPDNSQYNTV